MPTAFKVLKDRYLPDWQAEDPDTAPEVLHATAGDTVYRCTKPDYGVASDDWAATGIYHITVTKDPGGDYPFFTIPETDIERLDPTLNDY